MPEAADRPNPTFDVVVAAPVFFDLIFSGLNASPRPGTEVQASQLAASPGGSANLAVAASRLGVRTALATSLGDDLYGRWCWEFLEHEDGLDLSMSRRIASWPTPVTVSIAADGDRGMVTREVVSPIPIEELLAPIANGSVSTGAAVVELNGMRVAEPGADAWWHAAAAAGTQIFADTGWDSTGRWDPAELDVLADCTVFTPNEAEALHYTRTDCPIAAARILAERVPLAVVTRGADGAIAVDSSTGTEVSVPAVPARACDPTGAGDVFRAALIVATHHGWPLADRLAFGALCAALAVEQPGGARAAPTWSDIAAWWSVNERTGDRDLQARYGFLTDVLPETAGLPAHRPSIDFAGYHAAPITPHTAGPL